MKILKVFAAILIVTLVYVRVGVILHGDDIVSAAMWPINMVAEALIWGLWIILRTIMVMSALFLSVTACVAFYGALWSWLNAHKEGAEERPGTVSNLH